MTVFDPGEPTTSGDGLLEDADGAPLPRELQRGGSAWTATYDALIASLGATVEDEVCEGDADEIMRRLAPILWPLLPSNDQSMASLAPESSTIAPRRMWLNAMRCVSPSDEFCAEVGRDLIGLVRESMSRERSDALEPIGYAVVRVVAS